MQGKGCLYWFIVFPFLLIINLYIGLFALLWFAVKWVWQKATATPETRKLSLIVGGVFGTAIVLNAAISGINGAGSTPTPMPPTVNVVSIQNTTIAKVYVGLSQTAIALPTRTNTNTPVATSQPADTAAINLAPTFTATLIPTRTHVPTATMVYIPPVQPTTSGHPSGTSGQCVDGQYTSAQHKQGACSHHGGVLIWWGP